MAYTQAITYGPNRDFRSFRNNTNLTMTVGSLLMWDFPARAGYGLTTTGSGLTTATDPMLYGYPNPYAFVSGYDAMIAKNSALLGPLVMGFAWAPSGGSTILGRGVGLALCYGHHPAAQVAYTSGAPATFSLLVAPYSANAGDSAYIGGEGGANNNYIGRGEPITPDSTNVANWHYRFGGVTLGSVSGAATQTSATFAQAQVFVRLG